MGDLSAYAAALGLSAKGDPSLSANAGVVTASQQQPDSSTSNGQDIADLQQEIAKAPNAQARQVLEGELNKRTGVPDQAARLSPYAQALGLEAAPKAAEQPSNRIELNGMASTNANQIPVEPGANTATTPQAPESWVDKYLRGPAEAGAATVTGIAAPVVGQAAGLGYGLINAFGDHQGAAGVANDVTQALTYQPRGQVGQRYAANVGGAMQNLTPIAGLGGEIAAIGSMAPAAIDQVRDAPAVADAARVEPSMNGGPVNPAKPRYKMTPNDPVLAGGPTAEDQVMAQFQAKNQPPVVNAQGQPEPTMERAAVSSGPTLADTPQEFQKAVSGAAHNPTLQRRIEGQSLPIPIDLTQGQATGDIHQISFEQNNRGKIQAFGDRFQQQNKGLAQNLDAVREASAPDVHTTGVATNQALVDSIKGIDAPIKADISAKYQALKDANGGEFPLSGSDFVGAADSALKNDNVTRFLPPEVKGMLDDLRDGGPMNYNDFENFRTILAQQERKAARAGDGTAGHALGVVRNSLESLPMTNETAAIKPLADAARSAAKARFDKIASDPAYKAAINDGVPIGEPSPIADGFIGKYVVGGKTANVKNLVDNLSGDPLSKQLMAAGVMDHIKTASGIDIRTNTGNVNQAGMNKAITALDQKGGIIFDPKSAQNVDTLGRVARYTQEQPKGSYVNNSNTLVGSIANVAKSAAEGAVNVAAHGVPIGTWVRNGLEKRSQAKAVSKSLSPTAGTTKLSDFPP